MPGITSAIISATASTRPSVAVPASAQGLRPKVVRSKAAQPVEVDGVPSARAPSLGEFFGRKYAVTEFHENGALASCVASAAADVGGQRYESGARVKLDRDGKPVPAR
jgi:hypothetical protein